MYTAMIIAESDPRFNFLSPFALYEFRRDGVLFRSIYQFYVYKKFFQTDPAFARGALATVARKQLILISNSRRNKIPANWDALKAEIMRGAYRARFAPGTPDWAKLATLPREMITFTIPDFPQLGGMNIIGAAINEIRGITSSPPPRVAAPADVQMCIEPHAAADVQMCIEPSPPPQCESKSCDEDEDELEASFEAAMRDNICAAPFDINDTLDAKLETIPEAAEPDAADAEPDEKQISAPAAAAPPREKPVLLIAIDGKPIDGGISIPLSTFKRVVKKDVPDGRLITIARHMIELDAMYKICVIDSDNWYGPILKHIVAAMSGPPVTPDTPQGAFAAALVERNKVEFA